MDDRTDEKSYTLENGVVLPWISFGTGVIWKYKRNLPLFLKINLRQLLNAIKHRRMCRELKGNLHIKRILREAYEVGFRSFDTGRIYGSSEKAIGKTVSRLEGAVITTKCSDMDVTRKCSPDTVAGNMQVSLKNLKREQADLYLLHWPYVNYGGGWLSLYSDVAEEYRKGTCRAFGACNLEIEHLKEIEEAGLPLPMVVQTEIHPLNTRRELRDYCRERGIRMMAHTPTARCTKEFTEKQIIRNLTAKYHKTAGQIAIRWHYQNGVIPVVSTFDSGHMREDLDIFDFELTQDEMAAVEALNENRLLLNSKGIDDPRYIYNA